MSALAPCKIAHFSLPASYVHKTGCAYNVMEFISLYFIFFNSLFCDLLDGRHKGSMPTIPTKSYTVSVELYKN